MKKFHINRLEKLYAYLGTVNPRNFYFDYWGRSEPKGDDMTVKPDLNVCGTTACALGWAGTMPEFRKRGLKLEWNDIGFGRVVYKASTCFVYTGEDAGARFFGLTDREADELFIPRDEKEGAMSLKDYRRRLRRFIDRKRRKIK